MMRFVAICMAVAASAADVPDMTCADGNCQPQPRAGQAMLQARTSRRANTTEKQQDAPAWCAKAQECHKSQRAKAKSGAGTKNYWKFTLKNKRQKLCLEGNAMGDWSGHCDNWKECLGEEAESQDLLDYVSAVSDAGDDSIKCKKAPIKLEQFSCECVGEVVNMCNLLSNKEELADIYTQEACFRASACAHKHVCREWKNDACGEPNIKTLTDEIRTIIKEASRSSSSSLLEEKKDALLMRAGRDLKACGGKMGVTRGEGPPIMDGAKTMV